MTGRSRLIMRRRGSTMGVRVDNRKEQIDSGKERGDVPSRASSAERSLPDRHPHPHRERGSARSQSAGA
jgi:hypothetical protein